MKEIIGSLYTEVSDRFQKGIIGGGISRTIKAEKHDLGVVEMEVKVIGQMDNTIDHTFESANRVYDVGGVSPTINTCGGGGLQPKILEDAQAIRMVRTEEGKALRKEYESGAIHHGFNEHREMELRTDGVSNTLSTVQKDNYICEKSIVAMRGRNPDNPSDRTVGAPTEQRLEPNSQGICNTLTSVQKDNLVMEKVALNTMPDGVCRTLKNQYAKNSISNFESKGTFGATGVIETVKIKQATSQGYIECEVGGVADLSFPESNTRRGRVQENGQVSPTLMAGEQDICRIENLIIGGEQKHQAIKKDGVCTCSTSSMGTGGGYVPMIAPQYRIRKLTPRECWRLMDFTDEDFEKAAQVNSNTQLYKQAGNSIVKNVLVAILGQMIPGKEEVYKNI